MAIIISSKKEAWDHVVKEFTKEGFDDEDITLGIALDEERQGGTGYLEDLVHTARDPEGRIIYSMGLWYPQDWVTVFEDGTIESNRKTYETRVKINEAFARLYQEPKRQKTLRRKHDKC